jgi:hypothetical protein
MYNVDLEGTLKPGSSLSKAMKKALGDDVKLEFGKLFHQELGKSPRGKFTASKTRILANESVDFTVQLAADTVEYPLQGYNVTAIEIYRKKEQDAEFTRYRTIPVSASNQTTFTLNWQPESGDFGKIQFAAFVRSTIFDPLIPLQEVEVNSVKEIEIVCNLQPFPGFAALSGGTAAATEGGTCPPPSWEGSTSLVMKDAASYSATVLWTQEPLPPNPDGTPPDPRIALYRATGTIHFIYTAIENLGCSVTPKDFAIRPQGTHLTVDYRVSPVPYLVAGAQQEEITISCPDVDPWTTLIPLDWLLGSGFVSEDGTVIEEQQSNELRSVFYRFVRK